MDSRAEQQATSRIERREEEEEDGDVDKEEARREGVGWSDVRELPFRPKALSNRWSSCRGLGMGMGLSDYRRPEDPKIARPWHLDVETSIVATLTVCYLSCFSWSCCLVDTFLGKSLLSRWIQPCSVSAVWSIFHLSLVSVIMDSIRRLFKSVAFRETRTD
jgi:hypothetical protein